MAAPIILWNPKAKSSIESDDAGNKIVKTTLAPPIRAKPLYEAFDPGQPRNLCYVPRLTSFCIRALSKYPEQLHQLGPTRLIFQRKKEGGDNDVLRAVLPKWKSPNFSLLNVDPRLWATIVQVYRNPPELLSTYPLQLSDQYVPLLNQISATPDFTLITILDLTRSVHLTDDTILSLKPLHNLNALDVSGCKFISTRGIEKLSRTLAFDELGEKRGPWPLRVLRMRYCYAINKNIFNYLDGFPLLCVVDLRDTDCEFQDIQWPFRTASDMDLFDSRISDALRLLSESHKGIFPNQKPYMLKVSDKPLPSMAKQPELSRLKKFHSNHGSFILLPPSRGASFTGKPMTGPIQYGNADAIEFKEKQAEKEEYFLAQKLRREGYENGHAYDDDGGECSCPACRDPSDSEEDSEYILDGTEQSRHGQIGLYGTPYRETDIIGAEAHTTASTEAFYRRRPSYSPPRLRGETETASSRSLALVRSPPNWNTLDLISSESQAMKRRRFTTDPQEAKKAEETKLIAQKKRKASMHAFQSVLSKRRRPPLTVEMSGNAFVNYPEDSPPPSPTTTVCDESEISSGPRLTLPPSIDTRPPQSQRPVFPGPPRLKLEPTPRRPASTMFATRGLAPRSRQPNIAERLKIQAQNSPRSKPSGIKLSSSFLKKPPSRTIDSDPNRKPYDRDKGTKPKSAASKSSGFNWSNWGKKS